MNRYKILLSLCVVFFIFFIISFFSSKSVYNASFVSSKNPASVYYSDISHIKTPEIVKAIYMTSCVASRKDLREKLVDLIEKTELNALVIDIKDYTGVISFKTGNELLDNISAQGKGCTVFDMKEFLEELHKKDIYVIGRVAVFQDPLYTKTFPDSAVKKNSNKNEVWKDRKGLSFVDVGFKRYWDYIVSIATSASSIGFDEINFDYIRFPSDGNMSDVYFSHSFEFTKRETLRNFFEYLNSNLSKEKIISSADIFGITTTEVDDQGIGQILEDALINFDFVSPMIYPSHYASGFNGWTNPNKVPYGVVKFSMDNAVSRLNFLKKEIMSKMYIENASSTVLQKTESYNQKLEERLRIGQLRPWLQDFDYPVDYTADMVRDQIRATNDAGVVSWMLWDPSNVYTKEALQ